MTDLLLFKKQTNVCAHTQVTVSTGIISTIAGTGTTGSSGDSGAASIALFNNPLGVAVDALGNVYIADSFNHRIRKVRVWYCSYLVSF